MPVDTQAACQREQRGRGSREIPDNKFGVGRLAAIHQSRQNHTTRRCGRISRGTGPQGDPFAIKRCKTEACRCHFGRSALALRLLLSYIVFLEKLFNARPSGMRPCGKRSKLMSSTCTINGPPLSRAAESSAVEGDGRESAEKRKEFVASLACAFAREQALHPTRSRQECS